MSVGSVMIGLQASRGDGQGVTIVRAFRDAGRLLDQRSPEVTAAMRVAGRSLRLFVEVRMGQDQMELEFPPELLAASDRHALGIYVVSNDIPAHEV